VATLVVATTACSAPAGPPARDFVTVDAPVIALTHARVIDGTGAHGRPNQTVIIRRGVIEQVGDSTCIQPSADARVIDLAGRTILPGLVMLHEHMFYTSDGNGYVSAARTFPPLYLAGGATTVRTGGSISWSEDLAVRRDIEHGARPGPDVDLTSPYIDGPQFSMLQIGSRADWGRRTAAKYAKDGATSFKTYEHLGREELSGVIAEAHGLGLKVTGHLCAVTFSDAAALGIDNLEHGLLVASDFVRDRAPDTCPPSNVVLGSVLDADWSDIQQLIDTLVARRVTLTSTLPVFETFISTRTPATQEALELMAPAARERYERHRADLAAAPRPVWETLLQREMKFERAFVQAGGLLAAGTDPTGGGGVVAGFSNQRAIELLVEAGFSPAEAIAVASRNGARYLGREDTIGTIAPGKRADLMVVRGDPEDRISAIEQVETVFKNGVGYDSRKLKESVRGLVGVE
jgi:imidazolonepropionase-like amidohydrolase